MKRGIKGTAFLLIIAIALNINIGIDSKYSLQFGISEVEAEQPWETLEYWNFPERTQDVEYEFTYNNSYNYRFRYKTRVWDRDFIILRIDSPGSFWSAWGIGFNWEIDESSNVDNSWSILESQDDYDSYFYYFDQRVSLSEGTGRKGMKLSEVLKNGETYIIRGVGFGGGGEQQGGYMFFERQIKNTSPTQTITQPSSNSPLQGRQAHKREAA